MRKPLPPLLRERRALPAIAAPVSPVSGVEVVGERADPWARRHAPLGAAA